MDNMSTNINELNEIDIQKLTSNIHKEIELGKTDDYISMERLNNLQQIQMQKLQQLDNEIKKQKEDEIEEIKENVSYFELVKNPIILLLLYVLLNHKDVILLLNDIKPLLIKDNYIINLLSNGIILIISYFILIKIME